MIARIIAATSLLVASTAAPLWAAGPTDTSTDAAMIAPVPAPVSPKLVFTLRGGVGTEPEYFGAEDNEGVGDFGFRFNYLALRNGREFGNPDPWAEKTGLNFGGSFRIVKDRDTDDFDELAGLDDIDTAVELGVSASYGTENFNTFAELRRGFGGHEGWVAEIGADAIFYPVDRLRLSLGPRVFFGDDEYSNTYFGITASEASAALPQYDLDGGLVSAGVEFGARYQINDLWGVEGAVTWEKFQGDAADSPIVEQGSDEQWGARIGITRVFSIGG